MQEAGMTFGVVAAVGMLSLRLTGGAMDPAAEKYWPQWRGPYATGVDIYLRGYKYLYAVGR